MDVREKAFTMEILMQKPYVLITAGGTSVPIDRVRKITNDAKGGFGVLLAQEFIARDMNVVFLCTRMTQHVYEVLPEFNPVIYDTYDEYVAAIDAIVVEHGKPVCAFSTAAVSDFAPEHVVHGKISSGEAQTLILKPLPKVLNMWREKFGRACYIVGCKLTDHDDGFEHLFEAAQKQNARAHLNLTVANFNPWQRKQENSDREVWLVKPDGGFLHVRGAHRVVTSEIVSFVVRQMKTTWAHSVYKGTIAEDLPLDLETHIQMNRVMEKADRLLAFCQNTSLLKGSPGNVVLHDDAFPFTVVTPRAYPHKEYLHVTDLILARLVSEDVIEYWAHIPLRKPSIDTFVYEKIFQHFGALEAAVHFHNGWVLNAISTEQDFPCGSAEEAQSMIQTITRTLMNGNLITNTDPTMIELVRHGHVLFFFQIFDGVDTLSVMESQWKTARDAYGEHLEDIGKGDQIDLLCLNPIFDNHMIVGVAAQHREEGWYSFFLLDSCRGRGLGEKLVQLVRERRVKVGVHANCDVEQFYVSHGFTVLSRKDSLCVLHTSSVF